MKILALNKKASFDYQILETYEAGIVLFGYEVKSLRNGQANLKELILVLEKIIKIE
jgi:SsrA-binding protein